MSNSSRISSSSDTVRRMAELAMRKAQEAKPEARLKNAGGAGTALVDTGKSWFEAQATSMKLNLTGQESRPPILLQTQGGTPQPLVGPTFTPLTPTGSPEHIPLGEVSHQDGTFYSQSARDALDGSTPGATYCAVTALQSLAEAIPGWAGEGSITTILTEFEKTSSIEVWGQIYGDGSAYGELSGGQRPGLTPGRGEVLQVELPDGGPLPVELTVDGHTLPFNVTEVDVRNNPSTLEGGPPLETLADLEVGDVRAVVMRQLNYDGQATTTETGHWVHVERTEEGYRLVQSAPQDWALLGGTGGTPEGGVYVQEFTGPEALADLSNYIHAEAQYSAMTSGMYAVAVLEPVAPE